MEAVERSSQVRFGIEPTHRSGRIVAAVALVIAGLVLGAALVATTLAGLPSGTRVTDTSYDQIETLRGSRAFGAASAGSIDDSYDRIESMRGAISIGGDRSYDQVERLRGSGPAN